MTKHEVHLQSEGGLQTLRTPILPLEEVVWVRSDIMGGEPCFYKTRVPLSTLWVHLDAGEPLDIFFRDFEGVTPEQVHTLLSVAAQSVYEKVKSIGTKGNP
jgi:uncharacterized protein (DUF433 family)